jgi:hypothetical protein
MPKVLHSTSDITGRDYTAFLDEAFKHFTSFSLVWRKGLSYDQNRHTVGHDLARHELQKRQGSCWPGTQLFGVSQTIITYGLNADTARVLSRPASLFAWLSPSFPEDLAFYLKNGHCGFASVAHEGLAWILDMEFASALPNRYGFSEESMPEKEYRMFDYVG